MILILNPARLVCDGDLLFACVNDAHSANRLGTTSWLKDRTPVEPGKSIELRKTKEFCGAKESFGVLRAATVRK